VASDSGAVQIVVTADDNGASSVFNDVLSRINAIEAELQTMSSSGERAGAGIASGASAAADGMTKVAATTAAARTELETFAGHTATVTKGLDAMGLEAAGASARIEGLAGVLQDFGKAAPELLAITAAILAVSSAFSFFKNGIDAAAEMQSQMETLRAAVDAQGGSWATAQKQIEAFAQSESMASGITQNELVEALNKLVTSGTSVGDAMKIVGVAEEVAIAKHMDLMEVTNELQAAEAGRGQALARLDPQIRQLIASHANLSTILKVLHKDNQDQIDDGSSMERAAAREKAAQDAAAESLGTNMLPALTYLDTAMIGAIKAIELFGQAIGTGIHGAAFIFVDSAMAMVHGAEAVGDALKGDFKDGAMQVGEAWKSLKADGNDLKDATFGWIAPALQGMNDLLHMHQIGHQVVNQAVYLHDQLTKNLSLAKDPKMGLQTAGGTGSDYIAPPTQANAEREDVAGLTGGLTALDAAQKAVAAGQKELGATFSNSATSLSQAAQAATTLHTQYVTSQAAIVQYTAAIRQEETEEKAARTSVEEKYQAYRAATAALAALQESLSGKNKLTKAEKDALKEATDAQKTAEDAYKGADASLKNVTESLKKHTAQLDESTKKSAEFIAEQNKIIASYNDTIAAADASAQKERETFDLSLKQQVDYWAKKLADAEQKNAEFYAQNGYWDQAMLEQQSNAYKQLESVQVKAMEDARQQAKKVEEEEAKDMASFLDELLTKHASFASAFKSLWDQIAKSYIDDITKMVTQGINALGHGPQTILKDLFGGSASGAAGSSSATSAADTQFTSATQQFSTSTQTFTSTGTAFTSAGSTFTSAANTTQSAAQTIMQAAQHLTSGTGAASAPGAPGSDGSNFAPFPLPANFDPNDIFGTPGSETSEAIQVNLAGVAGSLTVPSGQSSSGGGGGSSIFGQLLSGAAVGGSVAGSTGGNSTWGSVGGAAGAAGGFILGNMIAPGVGGPIGEAIGSAIGGIVGGLFGPHETAADQPDVSDTGPYGTFVSDINGAPGTFNGSTIDPGSQYWTGAGGTSLGTQIGSWISDNASDLSSLPQVDQSMYQQLQSLAGNGSGADGGLGIASESQGVFTLTSGQQISVQAYESLINQWQSLVGANSSLAVPAYSIARTYPNFNVAGAPTATGLVGGTTSYPNVSGSSSTGSSSSSGAGATGSGGKPVYTEPITGPQLGNININLAGANIVGPGGLTQVAQIITQAIQRLQSGQLAGGYGTSLNSRLTTSPAV
jgi:hypothetical protein